MKFKKSFLGVLVCSFFVLFMSFTLVVKANSKTIKNYFEGTSFGYIQKELKINNEVKFFVSTDINLYIITDEKIEYLFEFNSQTLFVDVIKDVNKNNYDELIVMTDNKAGDNIFVYDTKSYDLLYSYSTKMNAYDSSLGYYEEIVYVEDYYIDSNKLLFVAGYKAFALNITNGKLLWEFVATNNLWTIEPIGDINNDSITDYAITLQPTKVIAISGKNGKEIYNVKVSDKIKQNFYEIETSIWSLQYDEKRNILYAASENGYLYLINPKNGKIIEKHEIYKLNKEILDSYYDITNINSPMFKLFKIILVDDIDGDGVKDLIYYQLCKDYTIFQKNIMKDNKLLILSGKDYRRLQEISLEFDVFGKIFFKNHTGNIEFYIPITFTFDSIKYKKFSVKDLKYIGNDIVINFDAKYNTSLFVSDRNYYLLNNNYLSINNISDNKESIIPFINTADFVVKDHKMLIMRGSGKGNFENLSNEQIKYLIIELIDLKTNEIIFTHNILDVDNQNSYVFFDYSIDINNDGIIDIMLVKQQNDLLNSQSLPQVIILDGKDGKLISTLDIALLKEDLNTNKISYENHLIANNYYQAFITDFKLISDLNNDGVKDYYVRNSRGDIFFIDAKSNNIINYYIQYFSTEFIDYSHFLYLPNTNLTPINDLNGDGLTDFVLLYKKEVYVLYSEVINNKFTLNDKLEVTDFFDGEIISIDNQFGDIDNDGIDDIVIYTHKSDSTNNICVLSSKTGKIIANLSSKKFSKIYLSNYDINKDGLKEVFKYETNYDSYSNVSLFDISNMQEKILFLSNNYYTDFSNLQPAQTFKDKDNNIFIAINVIFNYGVGNSIEIYSLAEVSNLVDIITIVKEVDNYYYNENSYGLGDIRIYEQNNVNYLYGSTARYRSNNYIFSSYICDLNEREIKYFYKSSSIKKLEVINNKLLIQDLQGKVIVSKINNDFKIKNLVNNQKINKIINLQFENKQPGYVYIYVDNNLVGKTTTDSFSLKLLEGKHNIKLTQIDDLGIESFYSLDVNVTKNYTYLILIPLLTISLFTLAIILPRRKKRYELPSFLKKGLK